MFWKQPCHARGRTRAAGLLLVCAYFLWSSSQQAQEPKSSFVLVHPKDETLAFATLSDVATYLRADDDRLVRPGPSDKTWDRQDSEACGTYLEQAYNALVRRNVQQDILIDAVHVISLCTTNRPKHRAKLTSTASGVAKTIVSLLSSSSYTAMAAAAECIWISSFSSQPNHQAFGEAGAIKSLAAILTNHQCNNVSSSSKRQCHLAQMWAAAALQNMAAAYCDSDWGGCDWVWAEEPEDKDEKPVIVLEDGMHVKFNPVSVRLSLIHNTKLLETLKTMVCTNVKVLEKAPWERTWPSRATVDEEQELSSSVATWGAIGAIRNLLLSPEFHDKIPQGLLECLCDHAVRSPDWLEYTKAKDAIYRLGLDRRHVCAPLYDDKTCSDFKDWKDYEGASCKRYEKKRWCAEYRDYVPSKEEWKGEAYIKAGEACCACGGGNHKQGQKK